MESEHLEKEPSRRVFHNSVWENNALKGYSNELETFLKKIKLSKKPTSEMRALFELDKTLIYLLEEGRFFGAHSSVLLAKAAKGHMANAAITANLKNKLKKSRTNYAKKQYVGTLLEEENHPSDPIKDKDHAAWLGETMDNLEKPSRVVGVDKKELSTWLASSHYRQKKILHRFLKSTGKNTENKKRILAKFESCKASARENAKDKLYIHYIKSQGAT
ncbi:MAG: hypothetical protein ACE5DI_00515 [Candidatus Micrarchaeia archaeon]